MPENDADSFTRSNASSGFGKRSRKASQSSKLKDAGDYDEIYIKSRAVFTFTFETFYKDFNLCPRLTFLQPMKSKRQKKQRLKRMIQIQLK